MTFILIRIVLVENLKDAFVICKSNVANFVIIIESKFLKTGIPVFFQQMAGVIAL